jgi:glucoamylase
MPIDSYPDGRVAFGRPGLEPRWTSSSKDGVGTAYAAASRVWFTISHGILNEIYYPTIDRPQVRDMQFLITDGDSLFHEERRDLVTEIAGLERDTLGYHIVNSDPAGRYRIVKEVIADPHQPCVLVNAAFEGDEAWLDRLQVYALLAPHLEVGGWGNSARVVHVAGTTVLVAWKGGTWLAMGADTGFTHASCGYVGASDGWQDLHDNYRLDWEFDEALDGNVAVIGNVAMPRSRRVTIGIAFGHTQQAAVTRLSQSLAIPFETQRSRYVEQWRRACCWMPALVHASHDEGRLYGLSRNLLLAHEDKTFAGALIASASIPWGNSKGDEDLGGYHLVWTRDMVQSVTGLMAAGDTATALRSLVYLACSQHPDGGFSQNFWIDGTPYWIGVQLDEVAFPVILAWRLWKGGALQAFDPHAMVMDAARFLVTHGPATQQERWEECAGYSPSTLAATIASLVCAADFAGSRGDEATRAFLLDHADFLESHVEGWTVTTDGTLVPGIPRHYIRICPAVPGEVGDDDPNRGVLVLANQRPGARYEYPAKEIVDAGFLELVRYGIRRPVDSLVEDSLRVVDAVLKVDTPVGPCWRRYNHDGYGPTPDGGPYEGWGQGRAWPLLAGERAHYELAAGRPVGHLVAAIEGFASKGGMLPEQVWDDADIPAAGMYLGRTSGSAMPLMWAHAEYVKLLRSIADGRVFDFLPVVADRYLQRRGRMDLEIWKPLHQVRDVKRGQVLRVQADAAFRLQVTYDEWQTISRTESISTRLGVAYVDLAVPGDQQAPIAFRFEWVGGAAAANSLTYEVRVVP